MTPHFRPQDADNYDQKIAIAVPGYDTLHRITAALLATRLPADARILVVGAGTGADILALYRQQPAWHITAVEPLAEMLAQARAKTADIASIHFHHGYLADLPQSDPFDAAVCHLVMHFIAETADKRSLLEHIAARLKPAALLLHSDVIATNPDELPVLIEYTLAAGMPVAGIPLMQQRFTADIHGISTDDFVALAQSSGFTAPHLYFRVPTIAAWLLERRA